VCLCPPPKFRPSAPASTPDDDDDDDDDGDEEDKDQGPRAGPKRNERDSNTGHQRH